MTFPAPLISASDTCRLLRARPADTLLVDCRFSLQDPAWGRQAYARGHLPGAAYAHLDHDLSGPVTPGRTGRHPLPSPAAFAATLRAWGVNPDTGVIAYDDAQGAFACRLWWMLHWIGHERQAVLDGGLQRWLAQGGPLSQDMPQPGPGRFAPRVRSALSIETAEVLDSLADGRLALVDCRDAERYAGHREPIDPVAGHIPGAYNHPHSRNVDADGRFLPPPALRDALRQSYGTPPAEDTVLYCGSGVSACHAALASVQAGRGLPRLYVGSWSEWIADGTRPVAQGAEP